MYLKNTIFILLVLIFCAAVLSVFIPNVVVTSKNNFDVIIDAGHGLPDGGAVASDGTLESELNLQIADQLFDVLSKSGLKCKMIRNDQHSIYTQGETIHAKKVSDIKNRVDIAKKNSSALVISIHMNTYPSSNVSGAQVFYSTKKSETSEMASEIQNVLNNNFNTNKKTSRPISSNIYLFNNIPNDSLLIECGFLTNQDDLSKLKDNNYQKEFANAIAEVITYKLIGG